MKSFPSPEISIRKLASIRDSATSRSLTRRILGILVISLFLAITSATCLAQSGDPSYVADDEDGMLAAVSSGAGVLVVLLLGGFGLVAVRVGRSQFGQKFKSDGDPTEEEQTAVDSEEASTMEANEVSNSVLATRRSLVTSAARERKAVNQGPPVTSAGSIFGAYQVDQEVGKLVLGQPHRTDVLSSRATDDRRAVEASLIKIVRAGHSTEDERRRARGALEEYGFVARHCATLLLAPEAFDRTSAARSLGEIGSAAALPFLLEALYDFQTTVRNQAVVSIGELKVPSAIGALLDMSRKHPNVPSSLVRGALSACSVEGLDPFDTTERSRALPAADSKPSVLDITHLEPVASIDELPETLDDETFRKALVSAESTDLKERTQAIDNLAQYEVQDAVSVLSLIAIKDKEPALRALAIGSLGSINHESIFPAVLIGMADDSREVRAAAARALSRLRFDRSDAYVRVIELADEASLRTVAAACIKAGIVSQNIDRLSSDDRRHIYEAFCLICLLAKAGLTWPVLNAIREHSNPKVRLNAVHLLVTTGRREVLDELRDLTHGEQVSEEMKTAIIERMYKLEQSRVKAEANEFRIQEPGLEDLAGKGTSNENPSRACGVDKIEPFEGKQVSEFENSAGNDMP